MNLINKSIKKMAASILAVCAVCSTFSTTYARPITDHIMMDENNSLKHDFWFLPTISFPSEGNATVSAKFKLPGYSNDEIICVIKNKNYQKTEVGRFNLIYNEQDKNHLLIRADLNEGNYEILLYKNDVADSNFIAKSELVVLKDIDSLLYDTISMSFYNQYGEEIPGKILLATDLVNSKRRAILTVPSNMLPRGTYCLKVVSFVEESKRGGKPIDINVDSFEMIEDEHYVEKLPGTEKTAGIFCCSMNYPECDEAEAYGNTYGKYYEHHFYINEIKPENFLFKSYYYYH